MNVDVLVFGAHPDDVEYGVGGTLLLLREQGVSFGIYDFTKGEMASRGNVEEREKEADRAASFLGAKFRRNFSWPDAGLVDSIEYRKKVAGVIRKHRPKVVLAPFWRCSHNDHVVCGEVVAHSFLYCSLKKTDSLAPHKPQAFLYYLLHGYKKPSFIVDITSVFSDKLKVVKMHASQGDYWRGLEVKDKYFGMQIGTDYGEPLISDKPIGVRDILKLVN